VFIRIARQNLDSQAHQHAATSAVHREVATEVAMAELLLPVVVVVAVVAVDDKSTSLTFVHLLPSGR
jgi:hypothetical protein